MPRKKRYYSSSSDDDDVPLKVIKQDLDQEQEETEKKNYDLYKTIKEKCEFCDEIFHSRYQILVHNARHIIIPLINHEVCKCYKCHQHFLSKKHLLEHKETYHAIKIQHVESKHKNSMSVENQNENKHHNPNENNDYKKPDPRNSESQIPSQNNSVEKVDQYKVSQTPDWKYNNNEEQNDQNLINMEENEDIIDISDSSNDSKSKSTLSKINKTEILNSMFTKEPLVTCDVIVNELLRRARVKNTIEKQPVVLVEDTLSRLLYQETYVEEKTFVEHDDSLAEIIKINYNKDSVQEITQENELKNFNDFEIATIKKVQEDKFENVAKIKLFHMQDSNSEIRKENIRNKLIFEDDEDVEEDLISFDNFEYNLTHLPGADRHTGVKETELYLGKMLVGTRAPETSTPSVHYDELIEDKMCVCQRCGMTSSNRFKSIQHELIHMKFTQHLPPLCPHCDRYIDGNNHSLKHIGEKHLLNERKTSHLSKCSTCGLRYYNWYRHKINYHFIYICSVCGKRFVTESERIKHTDVHNMESSNITGKYEDVKLVKVCEVCFLFFKSNQKHKYVYLREHSEVGKKQKCDRCEKLFFNIKLVKLTISRNIEPEYTKKKKTISNEERLRHIQLRLKKMNKLSRFYDVVLF
ncbi:uncharacterized protein LOC113229210 [Hyposmocoma kahamanoa]|uniref:uncharacterized protein LOC113229210 n=1 Tax=Hyposmocoma kahamanoa TaxID=1477025 RepID=UPI000E6D6B67|nr:uncharacterized protein LOC113229210 [Hyposmocoma kahamanoa]